VPKERFTAEPPSDTRLSSVPFTSREESGKSGTDSLLVRSVRAHRRLYFAFATT
jgi:hypothetical protein